MRAFIVVAAATVLVGCGAIIPATQTADPPGEVSSSTVGGEGGCGPIGQGSVRGLGLPDNVPQRGAVDDRDLPPLRASDAVSAEQASELGLLISLPALPRGLRLLLMSTNVQGTSVRYVLAPESVSLDDTFHDVYAAGGAQLFVYHGVKGASFAEEAISQAADLGLEDRYALVRIGGQQGAVSEGDDRGGFRQRNVSWSDDRWVYRLYTGFETVTQAIDLARDIQCNQGT